MSALMRRSLEKVRGGARLNADLKHAITTSVPKRTGQGLLKKTEEHMTMVASTPERVKSYFKDKHVSYAADSQ